MTNTLNYKFNIAKLHHFDTLVGMEYYKSRPDYGETVNATVNGSIFKDFAHAYPSLADGNAVASVVTGEPAGYESKLSYFARVNYDFDEKYMLTAIIRADGSSNFSPDHRWGYFPSVSAGWVISNEKFMESTASWLDFLKLRAGWGQNGNCNLPSSQWRAGLNLVSMVYILSTTRLAIQQALILIAFQIHSWLGRLLNS